MKQTIILLTSLIILIAAGMWQINYIEESSMYIISDAEYVTNLIKNNNFKEAKNHLSKLEDTWNNMSSIWDIFIMHDEIDDIRGALVNFKMYTELENKEEAIVYSEQFIQEFVHLNKRQKISIENVF